MAHLTPSSDEFWRLRLFLCIVAALGIVVGLASGHVIVDRAAHSAPVSAVDVVEKAEGAAHAVVAAPSTTGVMAGQCGQFCQLACVVLGIAVTFILVVFHSLRGAGIRLFNAVAVRTRLAVGCAVRTRLISRPPSLTALCISRT